MTPRAPQVAGVSAGRGIALVLSDIDGTTVVIPVVTAAALPELSAGIRSFIPIARGALCSSVQRASWASRGWPAGLGGGTARLRPVPVASALPWAAFFQPCERLGSGSIWTASCGQFGLSASLNAQIVDVEFVVRHLRVGVQRGQGCGRGSHAPNPGGGSSEERF